ncbi:hypothetical protein Ciccas_013431 [Cichlidogyrus casuarinus]|uniref:Uncharacterized protein n=1 Tax=Cichlidogyrus casuarinus TaxID=1844966 RepID=A0ABD2PKK7_9PLAT
MITNTGTIEDVNSFVDSSGTFENINAWARHESSETLLKTMFSILDDHYVLISTYKSQPITIDIEQMKLNISQCAIIYKMRNGSATVDDIVRAYTNAMQLILVILLNDQIDKVEGRKLLYHAHNKFQQEVDCSEVTVAKQLCQSVFNKEEGEVRKWLILMNHIATEKGQDKMIAIDLHYCYVFLFLTNACLRWNQQALNESTAGAHEMEVAASGSSGGGLFKGMIDSGQLQTQASTWQNHQLTTKFTDKQEKRKDGRFRGVMTRRRQRAMKHTDS